MEINFQQDFLNGLQDRLETLEIEHRYTLEGEGEEALPMLRALFATTGNGEGQVTTDILFNPNDTGITLLQIYSTIALNIADGAMDELFKLCNSISFYCPLGAFGVYLEGGHVYHKYNMTLNPISVLENSLNDAEEILAAILTIIGTYYQLIHTIAGGLLTFEEAKSKGLIG